MRIIRIAVLALALLALAGATGCNTMQGVGRDIKQGGQALEEAAS
jgi:predicted small secreted protein